MAEWLRRLWFLLNRRRFEAELARDMNEHRALMDRPAAFGNALQLREQSRDIWGWRWLDDAWRDVQLAVRGFRRAPGFTLVALTSLALGFALAASTMAVVNVYLIRAMPFPKSDRLFHVMYGPVGASEPRGLTAFNWSVLDDIIDVADYSIPARFFLTDPDTPVEVGGLSFAPKSLAALGVHATRGRALQDQDFGADADRVAMISDTLWRTVFAGDPSAIGRTFHAKPSSLAEPAENFRIVGVLPPEFRSARDYSRGIIDVAVPLRTVQRVYLVRLRDDVPAALAEARMTTAVRAQATWLPPDWTGVRLESIRERYTADVRPMLVAITGAAALVLVIVCANVATLVLLRVTRRQKEFAVRAALGAGAHRLARMLLIETGVLCLASLGAGLLLTMAVLRVLAPLIEVNLGRSAPGGSAAIAIDTTVLVVVGALGLLVVLGVSCVPALAPLRVRLMEALRQEGRSGGDVPSMRLARSTFVALEVAGSLALLVACGLMVQSVAHLLGADLGFTTDRVVRTRIALPTRTYTNQDSLAAFFDRFTSSLTGVPNSTYTFTNFIPFYATPIQRVEADAGGAQDQTAGVLAVGDAYFATLGIDITEGRAFAPGDRAGADPVAIVSESLRRRLWPAGGAVGHRIRTAEEPVPGSPLTVWRTVIGVARDVRQTYVDEDLRDVYLSYAQAPNRYAQLYIRSDRPAAFWDDRVRTIVRALDPDVLVGPPRAMQIDGDALLAKPKFMMALLTGFGAFTLLLTLIGIYGVTAFAVAQRDREIAIRMALGAGRHNVVRLFLRASGFVLGCGIAMGLCGAVVVGRLLQSQLHGVHAFDAATLLGACALMLTAGLMATWWPARRATARNPALRLKEE